MDGLTAVREIRSAEMAGTLSRNMVIALTGNARQGQIDQALAAGMDDGELIMLGRITSPGPFISRHQRK
jgi:CheY-like chemotaxis protein